MHLNNALPGVDVQGRGDCECTVKASYLIASSIYEPPAQLCVSSTRLKGVRLAHIYSRSFAPLFAGRPLDMLAIDSERKQRVAHGLLSLTPLLYRVSVTPPRSADGGVP